MCSFVPDSFALDTHKGTGQFKAKTWERIIFIDNSSVFHHNNLKATISKLQDVLDRFPQDRNQIQRLSRHGNLKKTVHEAVWEHFGLSHSNHVNFMSILNSGPARLSSVNNIFAKVLKQVAWKKAVVELQ